MLESWERVRQRHQWSAILLGNGASQQVWDGFSYASLYDVAKSVHHPLRRAEEVIFERLGTCDFERVLRALRDALMVNQALGLHTNVVEERYRAIQRALAQAVAETHVRWADIPDQILSRIRGELVRHRYVFTTNYDLLVYWALLSEQPRPSDVRDFFWTPMGDSWLRFDPSDTAVPSDVARVLYVHGGLHLYLLPDGTSAKYVPGEGENLLDVFSEFMTTAVAIQAGPLPLIVTESDADSKRAVIESSSHLTFAYEQLANCADPLVIFGHSLGDSDRHIAAALNRHRDRPIAIGIRPTDDPVELRRKKAHFEEMLPASTLHFLDPTTHPLGHAALRIDRGGSSS